MKDEIFFQKKFKKRNFFFRENSKKSSKMAKFQRIWPFSPKKGHFWRDSVTV
jgi:hypothetical protein